MSILDGLLQTLLTACKAELDCMYKRVEGMAIMTVFVSLAGMLVLAALGFVIYALFAAMVAPLGPIAAAFIVAGICLVLGLILLGIGLWVFR